MMLSFGVELEAFFRTLFPTRLGAVVGAALVAIGDDALGAIVGDWLNAGNRLTRVADFATASARLRTPRARSIAAM